MNWLENILFISIPISFITMIVLLARAGRREVILGNSLADIVKPRIDSLADRIIYLVKHSLRASSLFLLLVGHRSVAGLKTLLHKLEQRFSGLIEMIHGRGGRKLNSSNRGAVSFFLEQIKVDRTTRPPTTANRRPTIHN